MFDVNLLFRFLRVPCWGSLVRDTSMPLERWMRDAWELEHRYVYTHALAQPSTTFLHQLWRMAVMFLYLLLWSDIIISNRVPKTLYFHQKTMKITYLGLSIDYSFWFNYQLIDYLSLSLSLVCFYMTFILFYCAIM